MLTDKTVKTLKAGRHADGGGLYLRVSPKGKRVWVKREQRDGRDLWKKIGEYPTLTLKDARLSLSSNSVDLPTALSTYESRLRVRRPEQVMALLAPIKCIKNLESCTRSELMSRLREKATTSPVMANRMLGRWKNFFLYCEMQSWIPQNPLSGVTAEFVGGKEKARTRNLSWEEVAMLLTTPPQPKQRRGAPNWYTLLFMLLTGLRSSEALWVLRNKKIVAIPTKENPDPAIHWLPDSRLIRWALRQTFDVPSNKDRMAEYLRRAEADYHPHDLRHTFSSRMADIGVAPHVIEKMLDHKMEGSMAVYNHAEYRTERIAAQRVWERKLLTLRRAAISSHVRPSSSDT